MKRLVLAFYPHLVSLVALNIWKICGFCGSRNPSSGIIELLGSRWIVGNIDAEYAAWFKDVPIEKKGSPQRGNEKKRYPHLNLGVAANTFSVT